MVILSSSEADFNLWTIDGWSEWIASIWSNDTDRMVGVTLWRCESLSHFFSRPERVENQISYTEVDRKKAIEI